MATEPLYVSQLADVNREAELAVRRLYKIPAGGTLTVSVYTVLSSTHMKSDSFHEYGL